MYFQELKQNRGEFSRFKVDNAIKFYTLLCGGLARMEEIMKLKAFLKVKGHSLDYGAHSQKVLRKIQGNI